MSTVFVASLQEKALAEARSAATEALKQRKASQAAASTSSEGGPLFSVLRPYSYAPGDSWHGIQTHVPFCR